MVPSLGLSKPKDIELTYFDIAGVAEKVRMTLLIGGVPFKARDVPPREEKKNQ